MIAIGEISLLRRFPVVLVFSCHILCFSCRQQHPEPVSHEAEILRELQVALNGLSEIWYPKAIDSVQGGFWSDFDSE
ncbi:hypothetical protein ACEZ3G_06775 [Maribacter algicola]|uniref:Uncharacterized protein n=1 Tax=Meishania litoralis TaxID=3434685 RepID=A0ACC7LHL7_9FLAO